MKRYNPAEIEPKWQKKWQEDGTYKVDLTDDSRPKFYGFAMLPYPSGTGLHTGHVRTYTLADVTVRAKRQQGFNAYNPIGWDAFGLPAENYALKTGIAPKETIAKATSRFREQLQRIGMSHDWSKEINTSHPDYYKWTQWIFTKLFEHGLAYQKESLQWWCDIDKTVLANEQVVGGKCWRHDEPDDPPVTKKALKQWFFKITEYADELLESTDDLDWPHFIKVMQKNWIGKSKGAEISFALASEETGNRKSEAGEEQKSIKVFTTRPDTIFGATFLVLAPEHPLAAKVAAKSQRQQVEDYAGQAKTKNDVERLETDRKKTGVFTGSYAINPATNEKIPIWVADYVLMNYGTGAIMAVPAHDERDFAFAKQFNLPIKQVIAPETGLKQEDETLAEGGCAVVFDPKAQKYAFARLANGSTCFFAGGVKPGEDLHQGILREVEEESGLNDISRFEEIGVAYAHYRNVLKQTNRKAKATCLLVILNSAKTVDTRRETHEKFELTWLDAGEVLKQWQAHNGHDYDHYIIFLKQAVARAIELGADTTNDPALFSGEVITGEGILIQSGPFTGEETASAREKIVEALAKQGAGEEKVNYKIRDWLISRQRYWGAPIPIIHCQKCGAVAVSSDQLPVELPEVKSYQPTGEGTSILASVHHWVNTTCPKCGSPAKRETDTMDGYACSSWYFLRYLDPRNSERAWNSEIANQWMPVDFYNGADHAVSHLLYARFWTHFFRKLGLVASPEPFKRLVYNAYILAPDGRKMSKSLGNVVDPLEVIDSGYGADALRVYEMFIAPYDMEAPWDTKGVPGTYRFLRRTWDLVQEFSETARGKLEAEEDKTKLLKSDSQNPPAAGGARREGFENQVLKITHKTIKKVTKDIEHVKCNTAVSAMMEMVNQLQKLKKMGIGGADWRFALESLVQLLAPFAPHLAEELWQQLGHHDSVHVDHWPKWEEALLASEVMTLVVQVNGKLRATLEVTKDVDESTVRQQALEHENIQKFTGGQKPKRLVYVPGKLLNIVI